MTKTFTYIGNTKRARVDGQLFEKNKPVIVDNGTTIRKLSEHPNFKEVTETKEEEKKEKGSKARSPKDDAKQS